MGLLDDLLSHVQQQAGAAVPGGASHADILGAVTHLLGAQGGVGGLAGLVQLFNQGGLGHVVQSWISTGQNLPITSAQLQQVLGAGNLQALAARVGIAPDVFGQQLAQVLPTVVDKLTPSGQLPGQDPLAGLSGGLGDAVGMLKKLL